MFSLSTLGTQLEQYFALHFRCTTETQHLGVENHSELRNVAALARLRAEERRRTHPRKSLSWSFDDVHGSTLNSLTEFGALRTPA